MLHYQSIRFKVDGTQQKLSQRQKLTRKTILNLHLQWSLL